MELQWPDCSRELDSACGATAPISAFAPIGDCGGKCCALLLILAAPIPEIDRENMGR